ncbi:MAG TPA: M14 family metallopeptidase, partial [Blastocatellia bacterium]|nr:M14 family metallopeptidase [Blastocatellia bacterium]
MLLVLIFMPSGVRAQAGPSNAQATQGHYSPQKLDQFDAERVSKLSELTPALRADSAEEFRKALNQLKSLNEEGVLKAWQVATQNPNAQLRQEAVRAFEQVRVRLWRNEYVPEIVKVPANASEINALTFGRQLDIKVLGSRGASSIVLLTPFALGRLQAAGEAGGTLYSSIEELQRAARAGNKEAATLASEYESLLGPQNFQVRVAVIDRSKTRPPDPGYSDWLGDREDIVAHNANYLAKLDVFSSDGSAGSIASHVAEGYTRRGYALAGFFTVDEFATRIAHFFPGETFDAGSRPPSVSRSGVIAPELANGQFHSYEQTLAEFTSLASANPTMAQVVQLGTSFEGREIFALKITHNISTPDPSKPDALVTGCHHAREWISVEPPVYFAHQLLDDYNTNDVSRYLVDHLVIWIVPVVNPDGLEYTQQSPNDQLDPIRLWRKNRRPINLADCGTEGIGVDLNRNYNFQWRLPSDQPCNTTDDVGASDNPGDETFRGPTPDSELEIKAIEALTNDPSHHFVVRLDYHNFDQLVLYPWGYQGPPDVDSSVQSAMARKMAASIQNLTGTSYTPEQSIFLYITTGDSSDYAYGVDHTAIPILVELRPSCCDFPVPEDQIGPVDQESWASASALLEWGDGPAILQAVQAYQQEPDNTFSRLVYSAHWENTGSSSSSGPARHMVIDARSQELDPGPIQVRLQFSKPMDSTSSPTITLGRQSPFNELTLQPNGSAEGWQKGLYSNDTWIGEATIPAGGDTTDPWRLAAAATDIAGLNVDGDPSTIASYATGTGGWIGYEGQPTPGDTTNILPLNLQPGRVEIAVDSPTGGERFVSGTPITVNWTLSTNTGFTPDEQQLWLSTDSGITFTQVAGAIPGTADTFSLTLPNLTTAEGRMRVVARNTSLGISVVGDTPSNFTIGSNVQSGISISVVSAQIVNQA